MFGVLQVEEYKVAEEQRKLEQWKALLTTLVCVGIPFGAHVSLPKGRAAPCMSALQTCLTWVLVGV